MLLFRSEEHVRSWHKGKGLATGASLSLEQAWRLADLWYADRISPDWRRRTIDEAQQVFTSLGLTSDFWRFAPRPEPLASR